MEASHRQQLGFSDGLPHGEPSSRQVRRIDPGAVDYRSPSGLARLELMVTTVFDRLTTANVPSESLFAPRRGRRRGLGSDA